MHVMVVDDEPAVLEIEQRLLRLAGYEVVTASGGPAALSMVDAGAPVDLVIADLKMPEMTGDEMARRLRDRRPGVKVLFVTGHSDALFASQRALDDGEAYLDKPFTATGLLEAVSVLMSGHINQTVRA
jgi:CheY-like chemotaxis protein